MKKTIPNAPKIEMEEIDMDRTKAALDNAHRWKYPPAGLPTRKRGCK